MRNLKSIILSAVMLISLTVSAQRQTVHVVALNDMHAYIDRAAALGGIIDSLRALYPELLVLSSGDNRTGNPINDDYEQTNRPMMEIMNEFGVAASALGNHEFDGRKAGFEANTKQAKFPFLCANISVPANEGFKIDPYKVFDVAGVKVGVVSVVQVNSRGIPDCLASNVEGLTFSDPVKAAVKYGDIVRNQCDVKLLLTHLGYERDTIVAFQVGDYDAILGGHSHTHVPSNTRYNNIIITQNENKMKYCTLLEFTVENGEVVDKWSKSIKVANTKQRNEKIANMVVEYNNNPYLNEAIGHLAKPISNIDEMGSFVTTSQLAAVDADVIVQNHGGVRYETHDAGDFTRKDVLMLEPFGNTMCLYRVNGADIKKILEQTYANDENRRPFVAGFKYEMTVSKDGSKPFKSVKIFKENGKKIKDKKTYTLAANNYVVSITLLKDREGNDTGKKSSSCIWDYLQNNGPLDFSNVVRTKIIEE